MKKWLLLLPAMLLVSCGGTSVSSTGETTSAAQSSKEITTSGVSSESTFESSSEISSRSQEDTHKLRISILGDSISTYEGYSNDEEINSLGNNAVWFPNTNYVGADLPVEETWWMKTVSKLDGELCCNNSFSGSCVMDTNTYNFRTKFLTNLKENTSPDVIIVYMGINDFAANHSLGDYDGSDEDSLPRTATDFSTAYGKTIVNLKKYNKDATIFCCTPTLDRKRATGSTNGNGQEESEYFSRIKTIAENQGCQTIDLYSDSGITATNIGEFTVDKLHPNSAGMEKIADLVSKTVSDYYSTAK